MDQPVTHSQKALSAASEVSSDGARPGVALLVLAVGAVFGIASLCLAPPAQAAADAVASLEPLQVAMAPAGPPAPTELPVIEVTHLDVTLSYQLEPGERLSDRLAGTGAVLLKELTTLSMADVRIRSDRLAALLERQFVVRRTKARAATP